MGDGMCVLEHPTPLRSPRGRVHELPKHAALVVGVHSLVDLIHHTKGGDSHVLRVWVCLFVGWVGVCVRACVWGGEAPVCVVR